MSKDLYDILGVSKDASESEIKKAYRKLSLEFHPDRNTADGAETRFKEINEAHEVLSDGDKRKMYDMQQSGQPMFGGMGGNPQGGQEFHDINDILKQFFGGAGGMPGFPMGGGGMPGADFHFFHPGMGGGGHPFFQQMNKPPPIIKNLHMSLEEAYFGGNFKIDIDKWNLINNVKVNERQTINVTIPAGMDENEVIILRDMGNNVDNVAKGDIKICVQIKPHPDFHRVGLDLIHHKKITLKESLCGFKFEMKHVNNKMLTFNNYTNITVIKPQYKKVVPNLGMNKGSDCGNLIIEFEVVFPDVLGDDQIEKLKEIL